MSSSAPTEFQKRIVTYLHGALNGMASTWEIGSKAFPEKWEKTAARGALVAQIRRAGYALEEMGLIDCVLPAETHLHAAKLCLGSKRSALK